MCPLSSNSTSPCPSPWQSPFYFLSPWVWFTLGTSHQWDYTVFAPCDWLISLGIMASRFISFAAYGRFSFFKAEQLSLVHAPFCSSSHLPVDFWGASPSWLLWIMLQWTWVCKYHSENQNYWIVWHFTFNFLRTPRTICHSGCIIFHSLQQFTRFPISLQPHQHSLFFYFSVCYGGHLDVCEVINHIDFDLQWSFLK